MPTDPSDEPPRRAPSAVWEKLPPDIVKSAGRVMQIFEFFDDVRREANISEVCETLGFPQSSTSELMRSLQKLGYLRYIPERRTFIVTSRVRLLGSWLNTEVHGVDRLASFVTELNQEFGQAAFISTRNDLWSQYVHVAQATTSLRLHLTPGLKRPIVRAASGLVLLSRLGDAEISRIVRRSNAEVLTPDERVDPREVLATCARARAEGHLHIESSLLSSGGAVIAIELPEALFGAPVALGTGGAAHLVNPHADRIIRFMHAMIDRYRKNG